MTQFESCRHVHPDGAYCGSPSLRERKYCYCHLLERARRLRRARAVRDNVPYRLEIQSLDNPYAIRAALTDIAHALAAGQLDPRVAGKLLYAIQLAASANRRIEKMEAEAAKNRVSQVRAPLSGANLGSQADDRSRVQEYPDLEQKLGLPPNADLDAEIDVVLREAGAEQQQRQRDSLPEPPPGVRPGSPAYRVFREEAYQGMQLQLNEMRHQLREFNEQKRQQLMKEIETMKKEVVAATAPTERRAETA